MKSVFTAFEDPGHSWLKVSLTDLFEIGLSYKDFSQYSYRNESHLYLEEDCDAPKFVEQWLNVNKKPITIKRSYSHKSSRIRNYPRNGRFPIPGER